MKKFIAILMIMLASTLVFVACTNNNSQTDDSANIQVEKPPLEDLLNEMLAQGIVRMPMTIDETLAKEAYHIDLDTVDEYAIAETGVSPGPGLVVMAKAKEGKLDQVIANMEALKQDKIGNAFYPNEQEAAENAEIIVDGNYVALFILNGEVEQTAIDLFNDSNV